MFSSAIPIYMHIRHRWRVVWFTDEPPLGTSWLSSLLLQQYFSYCPHRCYALDMKYKSKWWSRRFAIAKCICVHVCVQNHVHLCYIRVRDPHPQNIRRNIKLYCVIKSYILDDMIGDMTKIHVVPYHWVLSDDICIKPRDLNWVSCCLWLYCKMNS